MNGDVTCGECGAPMQEYDIYEPDTGDVVDTEIVCPNQWKEVHP